MKFIKILGILTVLIILTIGSVQAELVVKPKVGAGWQYDTNYYKQSSNERVVHSYLIQPGLELKMDEGKTNVGLSYTMDGFFYSDKESVPAGQRKASDDDFIGHNFNLNAKIDVMDRIALGLDDHFFKTRMGAERENLANDIERSKYSSNMFSPWASYRIEERFDARFRYQNLLYDYSDAGEDSMEHRAVGSLLYRFNRSNSLDLEYAAWVKDYDKTTSDYMSNQIKLIYRKQLHYYGLEVGCGFHDRNFDKDNVGDQDVFSYRASVKGQNPPVGKEDEGGVKSHIAMTVESNFNDLGEGNDYYVAERISINGGHLLMDKIMAGFDAYYQNSDYEYDSRDDNTYQVAASIGYKVCDFVALSMRGGYEERDSNFNSNDYDNKFLMLKVDLGYSLDLSQ